MDLRVVPDVIEHHPRLIQLLFGLFPSFLVRDRGIVMVGKGPFEAFNDSKQFALFEKLDL